MAEKFPFEVLWLAPEYLHEILIAELSDLGFDTFWESPEGLRAYCLDSPKPALMDAIAQKYTQDTQVLSYRIQSTKAQEWEPAQKSPRASFILGEQLYVGPPETNAPPTYKNSLRIRGALAFGDGDHPSTRLILEAMLDFPMAEQKVLDIGTGTGILALLAEQKGAQSIDALDNNPWAMEIAQENLRLNQSKKILLYQGYTQDVALRPPYDCILANLNFQVLAEELAYYTTLLSVGGHIFLGGFQVKDGEALRRILLGAGLVLVQEQKQGPWLHWIARKPRH